MNDRPLSKLTNEISKKVCSVTSKAMSKSVCIQRRIYETRNRDEVSTTHFSEPRRKKDSEYSHLIVNKNNDKIENRIYPKQKKKEFSTSIATTWKEKRQLR